MDSLDSRLIQLNQALLKLSASGKNSVDKQLLDRAMQVLSGAEINTGPGNDTVIINNSNDDCNCPPGPPGPPGEQGPPGPPGEQGPPGDCENCNKKTILIDEDYYATKDDFYIGVNSEDSVTVFLPDNVEDGNIKVIKSEMEPPMGKRKIIIKSESGQLIDGAEEVKITVSYTSVTLIYRGNEWHRID